jgi:hypothetical protein
MGLSEPGRGGATQLPIFLCFATIPRVNRILLCPQSPQIASSFSPECVERGCCRREPHENLGQATAHLFGVHILASARYPRNGSGVTVLSLMLKGGHFFKTKVRQGFLGTLAECLLELGGVNVHEPDFDLAPIDEDSKGVAVMDSNDLAGSLGADGRSRDKTEDEIRKAERLHGLYEM